MADRFAHPSHLAVAPLADRDDERGVLGVTRVRQQPDVGRSCAPALDDEPAREPGQITLVGHAQHTGLVHPRDTMLFEWEGAEVERRSSNRL